MRPLLSWVNWAAQPGVVLTGDYAIDGLGVGNLTLPQIQGAVYRAMYSGNSRQITVDLGQQREIGAIALAFPRNGFLPRGDDTIRVRLSALGTGFGEALDTKEVSLHCAPWGVWAHPVRAGIRANRVANPSGVDSARGWYPAGSSAPTQWGSASTVNALADVGGLMAARAGGTLAVGNSMQLIYRGVPDNTGIPVSPGQRLEVQGLLAGSGVNAGLSVSYFNSSLTNLAGASNSVAPRTPQWKYHRGEWTRLVLSPPNVAPAGTDRAFITLIGTSPGGTITDPAVYAAEVAAYIQDPNGTPSFNGSCVNLAQNVLALEAITFARYVTIDIISAREYLDVGSLWVGPAIVPQYGPSNLSASVADAGENVRQPVSGNRYATRGTAVRSRQFSWPLLTEAEWWRLEAAAREVGRTGQVLAIGDVARWRYTSMLGSLTAPPAPVRAYHQFWATSLAVEEDT